MLERWLCRVVQNETLRMRRVGREAELEPDQVVRARLLRESCPRWWIERVCVPVLFAIARHQ